MKKVQYESPGFKMPPVGSSWRMYHDHGVMESAQMPIHQYWENRVLFPQDYIAMVLETWMHSRKEGRVTFVSPKELTRITVKVNIDWEQYGWERV